MISKEDLIKIARLSQMGVSDDEMEALREKLSSVLAYVGKIGEMNLTDVEPTAHITGVANVMREDVVVGCDAATRDALLSAAPAREGDYIKVKAVFG